MKTVILISGYKRAGKDTVANKLLELLESYNASRMSFAEPMKQIIADTFSISRCFLEDAKNGGYRYPIDLWDTQSIEKITNMREILQRFGTEAMKKQFGDDVWVELLYKNLTTDVTLISDWRFKSELEYLKKQDDIKVVTIRVIRDGIIGTEDTHISEIDLNDVKVDFVIQNDSDRYDLLDCQIEALISCLPLQSNMMSYFDYFKCAKIC